MKKLFFVLSFLLLSYLGFSQTIPENKGFVTDQENLFTPAQYAELTKILTDYEQATSVEIAVLTVKDFESDIADFAQKTATKWGIGKKDVNNGLLIIISKNKRILRTQTGYGLEGYLPDGWLKLQGDSIVDKYFKNSVVTSTKKDTIEVLNKVNDVLNTGKNFLDKNVTDPDLRKALSEVNVLKQDSIKKSQSIDTTTRYFDGTKAYVLACMNRIGKEYSKDKNSDLIKENKKSNEEESIISWLLKNVPWYVWVVIVGLWILLFIYDPGLALQLLFLGLAGGKGGSGGFGGGKFGGGGSSSRW